MSSGSSSYQHPTVSSPIQGAVDYPAIPLLQSGAEFPPLPLSDSGQSASGQHVGTSAAAPKSEIETGKTAAAARPTTVKPGLNLSDMTPEQLNEEIKKAEAAKTTKCMKQINEARCTRDILAVVLEYERDKRDFLAATKDLLIQCHPDRLQGNQIYTKEDKDEANQASQSEFENKRISMLGLTRQQN